MWILVTRLTAVSLATLIFVTGAIAGAPLKGVDVKLGKRPGGQMASRTTDRGGNFDFGVLPKGNYRIALAFPQGKHGSAADAVMMTLAIKGPVGGAVTKILKVGTTDDASTTRLASEASVADFASDGIRPITGNVSAGDASQ